MRVAVFGLGYVGAVTATLLAEAGHDVIGVDTNPGKVGMIQRGQSPVTEPQLAESVARTVSSGRLAASVSADAAKGWEVAFVCVGTPSGRGGQMDATALRAVLGDIGRQIRERADYCVVAIRSTVLPHVLEETVVPLLRAAAGSPPGDAYGLVVTPEFLREGSSVDDFLHPPFALIGESESRAGDVIERTFGFLTCPIVRMAPGEALMVKYASNGFHALKVAFANEIGLLCAQQGLDGSRVMDAFRRDRKLNVSESYLRPGFAFGGSCLPKDVRALLCSGRIYDVSTPVLTAVVQSNKAQIARGVDAVLQTRKKKVGVVGLAFKSNTDDLRESPMVTLVETLIGKGCDVKIYDPNVVMARLKGANRSYIEQEIPHVSSLLCDTPECLAEHAEVLVFGTAGQDALKVLAVARPDQVVVDLTRGAVHEMAPRSAESRMCVA